jgi:hypothetical protein
MWQWYAFNHAWALNHDTKQGIAQWKHTDSLSPKKFSGDASAKKILITIFIVIVLSSHTEFLTVLLQLHSSRFVAE